MLSNKYFVIAIFALLLLVAVYNIRFFSSKKAEKAEVNIAVTQPSSEIRYENAVIPERDVISKDGSIWTRDPFSIEITEGKSEITVSGIIKREGKSHALINGRVYSINDAIGSSVIKDIKRDSVVISVNGIIKEIYLPVQGDIKEIKK